MTDLFQRKDTGLTALIADLSIRNLQLATIRANYARGDYKPAREHDVTGYVQMRFGNTNKGRDE